MVQLTRIYTKGGDKGKTSLSDGTRVSKHHVRVIAYGTVDEANSVIGIARLHCDGETDEILGRIQNDLFDLGADLATPLSENPEYPPLRILSAQVERLEQEIDKLNVDSLAEARAKTVKSALAELKDVTLTVVDGTSLARSSRDRI